MNGYIILASILTITFMVYDYLVKFKLGDYFVGLRIYFFEVK
jgi:hypothetical protein